MPSATQLREHRAAIASLTDLAKTDLATVFRQVETGDQAREALLDVLPPLADAYGEASATLAADWYDELRDQAGIAKRFAAVPADAIPREQAEALARWAVGPMFAADPAKETALAKAQGGVQRLVANMDRLTIAKSTGLDPAGARFARVASAGGCPFCRMLAGRGAVYHSEATAGGHQYHDHCHCIVVPSWDDIDVPPHVLPSPPELTPEPEFVERLTSKLRRGEVSPEELRSGAASASPLGQVNAEEALRVFAAEREAAKATAATAEKVAQDAAGTAPKAQLPTPQGSVAEKVSFPQETLDALVPKGGWTTATRAKTLEVLKSTPEGKQLLKTMDSFQSGGSTAIPRLRTDIEKYLAGDVGDMPQGRQDAIENFLSAVGRSNAGDRALFRGMSIPGDIENVAARYKVGDDLDLSLASFSTDKKLAQDFTLRGAGKKVRGANKTPVLVEWVGEGKRALPIEKLSKSRVFANEKEWVGAGRYAIEGVKRVKRNGVETVVLTIRQKSVW